jgi:hypothetical protein
MDFNGALSGFEEVARTRVEAGAESRRWPRLWRVIAKSHPTLSQTSARVAARELEQSVATGHYKL